MNEENEFSQIVGRSIANWHKREKPTIASMQGQYCMLAAIDIDRHTDKLYANISLNNPGDSWTYLPYGPFASVEEFRSWLRATSLQEDVKMYAILDKNNQPVGIAAYMRINPEHGVVEIGHLHYSSLLKRTPAATEAMYLMMRHAFSDLGYRRYEWKCNSLNEASKAAALRLGFKFEGIFRQSNVFKNRNRDTAWFSILDSEWPAIQKRLENWLEPANFTADGTQIIKLSM